MVLFDINKTIYIQAYEKKINKHIRFKTKTWYRYGGFYHDYTFPILNEGDLKRAWSYMENGIVYYLPYVLIKLKNDEIITWSFNTLDEFNTFISEIQNKYPNLYLLK